LELIQDSWVCKALVSRNREESIPLTVESIIGDFDSVEEAEATPIKLDLKRQPPTLFILMKAS
jgi:thiamine pyrophosphokinase